MNRIPKQFARFVSQNIFGMLGVSCYIIADTFFISKAAGADGITVLNLVLPVYNIMFAIGALIGVGSATRFAIHREQHQKEAEDYFSNGVMFALLISVFFVLLGIVCPGRLLHILGGDKQIVQLGKGYTRIFLLFSPFFMLNFICSAFVRNDDDPTLAMIGTMAGSLFNIIFDYVFMFPMKLGLAGAALATAASPVISILICSFHFFRKKNTVRFTIHLPSLRLLCRSAQLGVSAMIGELSAGVTTAVFNFLILGLAGNTGVAAYGIVANYSLVANAIFNGVSQGSQPLASECYGRGDRQSLGQILKLGMLTSIVISIVLYAGVALFTPQLTGIFNGEHSALLEAYSVRGMRIYFAGFLPAGINIVAAGYLGATNRGLESFLICMIRGVVLIAVSSILLSRFFGFDGVWMAFGVTEAMTLGLTLIILARRRGWN